MDLFSKRWNVRILAVLHESKGARFAVMRQALTVNADSLTRCLKFLIKGGWVRRNPGYGHPLRPEYILTSQGQSVAPHCSSLVAAVDRLEMADTVYQKWSVPLLVAIQAGNGRFNVLRETLGISPRALTQSLQRLCASGLVRKKSEYRLTPTGDRVATLGRRLVPGDRPDCD